MTTSSGPSGAAVVGGSKRTSCTPSVVTVTRPERATASTSPKASARARRSETHQAERVRSRAVRSCTCEGAAGRRCRANHVKIAPSA